MGVAKGVAIARSESSPRAQARKPAAPSAAPRRSPMPIARTKSGAHRCRERRGPRCQPSCSAFVPRRLSSDCASAIRCPRRRGTARSSPGAASSREFATRATAPAGRDGGGTTGRGPLAAGEGTAGRGPLAAGRGAPDGNRSRERAEARRARRHGGGDPPNGEAGRGGGARGMDPRGGARRPACLARPRSCAAACRRRARRRVPLAPRGHARDARAPATDRAPTHDARADAASRSRLAGRKETASDEPAPSASPPFASARHSARGASARQPSLRPGRAAALLRGDPRRAFSGGVARKGLRGARQGPRPSARAEAQRRLGAAGAGAAGSEARAAGKAGERRGGGERA